MSEADQKEISASGPLKSRQADWLDVHGGFVLLVGGVLMIALAGLLAEKVAVAPVFATFGCGLFVLGAFYSRIEGRIEASRRGFVTAVGAAQRLSRDQGFSAELQEEAVKRAVENVDISSRKPDEVRRAGEDAAKQAVEEVASELRHDDLVEGFVQWLVEKEGFPLEGMEQEVQSKDGIVDLVARKDREVLVVELTSFAGLLGPGNVFRLLHLDIPGMPADAQVRRAFVVPSEQKDELRISDIAGLSSIEIYGISGEGRVERSL
jgi:hypothetical protein